MKRFISFVLVCFILLLCTGCDQPAQQDSQELGDVSAHTLITLENSFTMVPLQWDMEMFENPDATEFSFRQSFCASYTQDAITIAAYVDTAGNDYRKFTFDWEGNLLSCVELPDLSAFWHPGNFQWTSDGTLYFDNFQRDGSQGKIQVVSIDPLGTVTAADIPWGQAQGGELVVSDSLVIYAYEDTLYQFDRQLQLLEQVTLDRSMENLSWMGEELYGTEAGKYLYRIDRKTGAVRPVELFTSGETFELLPGCGSYTLYMVLDDGIYGLHEDWDLTPIDAEEREEYADPILSFEDSMLGDISPTYIRDENTIFGFAADVLTGETVYGIFQRNPEVQSREVLTIWLPEGEAVVMEILAAAFNASNDRYFLQMETYPYKDQESMQKKLLEALDAGTAPDLLYNTFDPVYVNLAKQGYLADLSSLTEQLTGSARAAVMEGDACYRLPYTLTYTSLLTISVSPARSIRDFLTEGAAMGDGELLIAGDPNRVHNQFYMWIYDQYVQEDTCSFDDPSFGEVLELFGKMKIWSDNINGSTNILQNNTAVGLLDGSVHYYLQVLSSPDILSINNTLLPGETVTYIGLPGTTLMVDSIDAFSVVKPPAVSADAVPEGAQAFLEFILSDPVQTASRGMTMSPFPVTESALEIVLQSGTYCVSSYVSTYSGVTNYSICSRPGVGIDQAIHAVANPDHKTVTITEEDRQYFLSLLDGEDCARIIDPTLSTILWEEIQPYMAGDRSAEDTARILQSRVGIYMAE